MKTITLAMLLVTFWSCVKEIPEKRTIVIKAKHPDTIFMNNPDTLFFDVLSETNIDSIQLLENNTVLFSKYIFHFKQEKDKPLLRFKNQFIYSANSKGIKNLQLYVVSQESRANYSFSITVDQ